MYVCMRVCAIYFESLCIKQAADAAAAVFPINTHNSTLHIDVGFT